VILVCTVSREITQQEGQQQNLGLSGVSVLVWLPNKFPKSVQKICILEQIYYKNKYHHLR
jgi:hypothetical protein